MKITPIFLILAQASPLILAQASPPAAVAQLTPDNSLGAESSVVTPVNPTRDHITGGAARGSNLFHSFREFNVDVGRSVYFANPPAIGNILTRVTGGNPSNIFGTLGVLGDANLFLVNPNGMVFGRDARLDIRGSFFATTGDGIKLGENGLFSATDLDPTKLLQVRPEALFTNALANHMAQLNNRGNLAVGTGSTLALHGGEVTNSGSLTAPGGTVMVLGERIGLFDESRIDVSSPTGGGRVFIGGFLGGQGNIPTAARTYIGPDVTIWADATIRGDGGNVIVWADGVTGFYGDISARGGMDGGDGGFVEVSGAKQLIFRGDVDTNAALGNPGTLLLDPRNIIIADGSPLMEIEDAQSIPSDIFNGEISDTEEVTIYESQLEGLSGDSNVVLQATNDIRLADLSDNSLSFASGTGDITFIADADRDGAGDFSMADRADTINTNGRDIAIVGASITLGNINTSSLASDGAGELLSTAAVVSTGPGEALNRISGNLLDGKDVDLYQIYLTGSGTFSATTDGSKLDTQLFLFDGDGFGVYGNDDNDGLQSTLPAEDPLTPTAPGIYYLGINGSPVNPVSESGEIFSVNDRGLYERTGAGRELPLVRWENEGVQGGEYTITLTGVEGPSTTFAEAMSNSGAISLRATNGNITAGDLNAASSGAGGEISIDAAADILLDGSTVDASGVVGGGRDITLNSGGSILLNNTVVTSSTNGPGNAGKVTMTAEIEVSFNGGDASSQINSQGIGNAGGIEITTGTLSVTEGAQLRASTEGNGNAGKISITASDWVLFSGEDITGASSGAFNQVLPNGVGNAGGIEITTGSLEVRDGAGLDGSTFGTGDPAKISITASDWVLFSGEGSRALSQVNIGGVGAGGIEITTGTLEVADGALLSVGTFGEGDGGNISIFATERVLFSGDSLVVSQVESLGKGDAGKIQITTGTLDVTSGAQVSVSTNGDGNADTLSITASEAINISGLDDRGNSSGLFASNASDTDGEAGDIIISTPLLNLGDAGAINARTRNDSRGGDIQINTNRLSVTGGAQIISSSLESAGEAGRIEINARSRVTISGTDPDYDSRKAESGQDEFGQDIVDTIGPESAILSSALSTGNAGDVNIETAHLVVEDGARATASTSGKGNAGLLTVRATEVELIGTDARGVAASGLFASVEPEATGNAGDLTIATDRLILGDGARVSAGTEGKGNGGSLTVEARESVELRGSSVAGFPSLIIAGVLDAESEGTGGELTIDTARIVLRDGGQISAGTIGAGNGGNIIIRASESVDVIGEVPEVSNDDIPQSEFTFENEGVFPSDILTASTGTGDAGSLTLETGRLSVRDGGRVGVGSRVDGNAGSLAIAASEVRLDRGSLNAETVEGDQGNITIDAPTVVLRNNSGITTNATGDATGGNITISTENLVARDDSDISANAEDGRGGNISITAEGVFLDIESEITATSDRGVDGIVEIKTQEDPARGLISLAETPVDASSLISKGCEEYRGSEFIITGRGGIPPHPLERLRSEAIWLDWRALTDENSPLGHSVPSETSPVSEVGTPQEDDEIRQAQGWLQLPDGTIVLTAYPVKMTPVGPVMQHPGCQIILGEREQ